MIVIRADGNNNIGMGHIGRCLSIAKALKKYDEEVLWIISCDSDAESINSEGIHFIRSSEDSRSVFNSALKACLSDNNVTSVLVDSYNISDSELDLMSAVTSVYYLDDLNMFDYNVCGIINYNFEADEMMYANTNFEQRKLFLGTKYFPLNVELWDAPKCTIKNNVERVMLTSGSTDPICCIDKILSKIDPSRFRDIEFNILIGKFFDDGYRSKLLKKYSYSANVVFVEWGRSIVDLYNNVDILIAPGATMVFEALALNIPCMSFMFVDNQKAQCEIMDAMKIVPFLGDFRNNVIRIADKFEDMLKYERRVRAQKLSSNLIDGCGAQRIAEILINT